MLGRRSRPASPRAATRPGAVLKGPLDWDGSSSDETSSDGSSSDEERDVERELELSVLDAAKALTPDEFVALAAELSGSGAPEDLAPPPDVAAALADKLSGERAPEDFSIVSDNFSGEEAPGDLANVLDKLSGEGALEDRASLPIDSAVDGWQRTAPPFARQDGFPQDVAPRRANFDRNAISDALIRQLLALKMSKDLP
jgi:hypothetical protein